MHIQKLGKPTSYLIVLTSLFFFGCKSTEDIKELKRVNNVNHTSVAVDCKSTEDIKELKLADGDVVTIEIGLFDIEAPPLTRSEKFEISMMEEDAKNLELQQRFENYLSSTNKEIKVFKDINRISTVCGAKKPAIVNTEKIVEMKGKLLDEALENQRIREGVDIIEWNETYKKRIAWAWNGVHKTRVAKNPEKMTVGKDIFIKLNDTGVDVKFKNYRLSGWSNSVSLSWTKCIKFYEDGQCQFAPEIASPMPIIEGASISARNVLHPKFINKWQFLFQSAGETGIGDAKGNIAYHTELMAIAYRIVDIKREK